MCQHVCCSRLLPKELHTRAQDVEAGGVLMGLEQAHTGVDKHGQQGLCSFPDAHQTAVIHLHMAHIVMPTVHVFLMCCTCKNKLVLNHPYS